MTLDRSLSRRGFLKQSAAAATTGVVAPLFIPRSALAAAGRPGANDRVKLGLIGTRRRGGQLLECIPGEGQLVAIADCHLKHAHEAAHRKKANCAIYQDYRHMLDKEKLDAVMIAVPDHNHALLTIHALQASLDVYVEKPLGLTIAEGQVMVRATRKYNRVCQLGTQQRSLEVDRFACGFVRGGGIGKVHTVLAHNYVGPVRYSGLPEEPVPEGLDWDLWCGQAELRPFKRRLFMLDPPNGHGWVMWRSYSGGKPTNAGTHGMDMIQWALGKDDTGPVEIWPITDGYKGEMRLCPVHMRYADGTLIRFDLVEDKGPVFGGIFIGEGGKIEINRNGFATNPADLIKDAPKAQLGHVEGAIYHLQDWIDCIKTREKPVADVEVGHRSTIIAHLVNIARELRRKIRWNPEREIFPGDQQANALLERPRRKGHELPKIA